MLSCRFHPHFKRLNKVWNFHFKKMVGSSELSPCDNSMTVTTKFRNSTPFDGYVPGFWIHSEVTFHIIVIVTNAEDIKIRIAEIRSVLCKQSLLDLRIPCQNIYIFIPINFSSSLVLYCVKAYTWCQPALYSRSSHALFQLIPWPF